MQMSEHIVCNALYTNGWQPLVLYCYLLWFHRGLLTVRPFCFLSLSFTPSFQCVLIYIIHQLEVYRLLSCCISTWTEYSYMVCVCVWWLSGLHSGLLIEKLPQCWHDVQSLFSIQQCDAYPPNIIPTPVHPAVMSTWLLLGGETPMTRPHPSAKGLGGTSGAHTHRLRDMVRTPASFQPGSGRLCTLAHSACLMNRHPGFARQHDLVRQ